MNRQYVIVASCESIKHGGSRTVVYGPYVDKRATRSVTGKLKKFGVPYEVVELIQEGAR